MALPTKVELVGLRPEGASDAEYEESVQHTISQLDGWRVDAWAKAADGTQLLQELELPADTLSYCYVVHALVQRNQKQSLDLSSPLVNTMMDFMEQCSPIDMRYAGTKWSFMMGTLLESISEQAQSKQAAPMLIRAVNAFLHMDAHSCTLIPLHLNLVRLARHIQAPRTVLPIQNNEIKYLPAKSSENNDGHSRSDPGCPSYVFFNAESGFTPRPTLHLAQEYFIHAASNYASLKQWARAVFALEHVLSTPTPSVATGFMVEAYKKWLLLNLLAYGKIEAHPPGMQGSTIKTLKAVSKPYDALADAFMKSNHSKLVAEAHEGGEIWTHDCNVGLVQSVVAENKRRAVTKLGKTYSALPLEQVATSIGLEANETAEYLQRLIEDGDLNARLDQPDNGGHVLHFAKDGVAPGPDKSELELKDELVSQTHRIAQLEQDIQEADYALSMSKSYIDSVRRWRNRKGGPGPAGEDSSELFPQGMDSDDEDVMADA